MSYVSSPYLPASLRRWGRENKRNDGRVDDLKGAVNNIKDELDENITIDDVRILIGEWIPMGANQMVALNDKLGSSERVQGGFFTSVVDLNPDSSEFIGESEGLTEVDILDFDETAFVNFEAEVHFPEDEGIVQVENFGMHLSVDGTVFYGIKVEAIMDRTSDNISVDMLARMLVDVHQDSSLIMNDLLSSYQSAMLDTVFLGDKKNRGAPRRWHQLVRGPWDRYPSPHRSSLTHSTASASAAARAGVASVRADHQSIISILRLTHAHATQ